MVAERPDPVAMTGGIRVLPDCVLQDSPPLDILLVPGGTGTRTEYRNETLLDFIRDQAQRVEVLASVCTGAALLGAAGLLDGIPATTNRLAFDWVESVAGGAHWDRSIRWADSGRVVTSAGVSAGTDMALHLISRLLGREVAEVAALRMEYRWDPEPNQTAPWEMPPA